MIRTIATLVSATATAVGLLSGNAVALVAGLIGLALVALSLRLSARKWSR